LLTAATTITGLKPGIGLGVQGVLIYLVPSPMILMEIREHFGVSVPMREQREQSLLAMLIPILRRQGTVEPTHSLVGIMLTNL